MGDTLAPDCLTRQVCTLFINPESMSDINLKDQTRQAAAIRDQKERKEAKQLDETAGLSATGPVNPFLNKDGTPAKGTIKVDGKVVGSVRDTRPD